MNKRWKIVCIVAAVLYPFLMLLGAWAFLHSPLYPWSDLDWLITVALCLGIGSVGSAGVLVIALKKEE